MVLSVAALEARVIRVQMKKFPATLKTADIKLSGLRNTDSQESFNISTFEPERFDRNEKSE